MSNTVSVEEMEAIAVGEPALQKALKMEKVFLTKTQERMLYENRQKAIQTYDATMEGRWEDGMAMGLRKGELIGLDKGIREGKNIGIRENKVTMAKNMLNKGATLKFIAEVTGLSLEELQGF